MPHGGAERSAGRVVLRRLSGTVAGIVRGHKGAITVETSPGEGATFRVWFPAGGAAAHTAAKAASTVDDLRGSGTILVNPNYFKSPDPPYVWADLYKTTCVSFIQGYGCIKSERNLEKKGIEGVLSAKLENNKADDIIAKLGALQTVLGTAPVEKRGELIVVTLDAYDVDGLASVTERTASGALLVEAKREGRAMACVLSWQASQ